MPPKKSSQYVIDIGNVPRMNILSPDPIPCEIDAPVPSEIHPWTSPCDVRLRNRPIRQPTSGKTGAVSQLIKSLAHGQRKHIEIAPPVLWRVVSSLPTDRSTSRGLLLYRSSLIYGVEVKIIDAVKFAKMRPFSGTRWRVEYWTSIVLMSVLLLATISIGVGLKQYWTYAYFMMRNYIQSTSQYIGLYVFVGTSPVS